MAFATKKWTPTRAELVSAIAEAVLNGWALPFELGGTAVSAAGASDAARAQDVLKTWGMLDSGLLVPAALLPTMGAASSGAGGAKGAVPASAAGDQRRALRGDSTFATELELTSATKADGTKLLDIESLGDSANRPYVAAAGSGGEKARAGSRGTDADIDFQLEPKGQGDATVWADPIESLLRRSVGMFAQADNASAFSTHGIAAPTVESFDTAGAPAAPVVLIEAAGGYYNQVATDDVIGSTCGFFTGACLRRDWNPTIYFLGNSAFLESRVWLAATQTDPAGATDLVTAANAGVGLWVDYTIHAPGRSIHLVTCSGAATNVSRTGVFSIDSSGRLDRNDGLDMLVDDKIRVGDLVTLGGFASPGTNGTHRVMSYVGSPKRRVVFDTVLTTESSPAGAVTVTHPGQTEIDTGFVITANARFAVRVRFLSETYQWQFATYNFTTKAWEQRTVSTGVAAVPPDVMLKMFWRLRALTTNQRKTAAAAMFFRRAA